MADKVLKVEGVGVLPPWDVARPLSPKRRRKTSESPTKLTRKQAWPTTSVKVAGSFVVVAAAILHLVMKKDLDTLGSLEDKLGLQSMQVRPVNDSGSDCMLPANVSESDVQMGSRDVFILADVPDASALENYSARTKMHNRAVLARHGPTPLSSDASTTPQVLMGKIKLEEAGTTWSQPQRPTGASSVLSSMSFRLSDAATAAATSAQERPPTYKLHWRTGPVERPRTYKLQWWSEKDVVPAAHAYELRWRRDVVSAPRAYELRWRK